MYDSTGAIRNVGFEMQVQLYRYHLNNLKLLKRAPPFPSLPSLPSLSENSILVVDSVQRTPDNNQRFIPNHTVLPESNTYYVDEVDNSSISDHTSVSDYTAQFDHPAMSESTKSVTSEHIIHFTNLHTSHSRSLGSISSINPHSTSSTEHIITSSLEDLQNTIATLQFKTQTDLDLIRDTMYNQILGVFEVTNRLRQMIYQNTELSVTRLYAFNIASTEYRLIATIPLKGPLIGELVSFSFDCICAGECKLLLKASGQSDREGIYSYQSENIQELLVVVPETHIHPQQQQHVQGKIAHYYTGIEISLTRGDITTTQRITFDNISFIEFYTIAPEDHTITLTEVYFYPTMQLNWRPLIGSPIFAQETMSISPL